VSFLSLSLQVSVLHMVPGFSDEVLCNMLQPPLRGLVLRTYGSGNVPGYHGLSDAISQAVKRGVVVVITSQCIRGRVDLERYQTSKAMVEAGAISGYDLTVEAAAVK
jgi:L-asparaginase